MARQFEPREGDGALFKVFERETEKHPHYTGNLRLNGQDHWVSAWIKESSGGKQYLSLSVKPKQPKAQKPAPEAFEDDKDLPF